MKMANRVEALESQFGAMARGEVHWLIQRAPQTRDQALDEYGRDKIGSDDDLTIFRVGFAKLPTISGSA